VAAGTAAGGCLGRGYRFPAEIGPRMNLLAVSTQGLAERAHRASPFCTHTRAIQARFGARVRLRFGVPLRGLAEAIRDCDVAFVMTSWADSPEHVTEAIAEAHGAQTRPRIVMVDWFDQTSTPFLGVLPYVDLYAKRQVLARREWYHEPLSGGYAFTDFLDRELHVPLGDWNFGAPATSPDVHKVVPGWNFGSAPTYRRLLRLSSLVPRPWKLRSIDVHARFSPPADASQWYAWYRRSAAALLTPLRRDLAVTESCRIPRRRYLRELWRSKIAFSPFGWGEVCFRDFEAACLGCALVKPAMAHLSTSPDLYIPSETYIPVRWDLADLERTIRTYIARPDECRRIAGNARRRFLEYFRAGGVLSDLGRVMHQLENPPSARHDAVPPMPWRRRVEAPDRGEGLARFAPAGAEALISLQTR
jgi:hypothetical protein